MPSWNRILQEIQECKRIDALDYVRRSYLNKLHKATGRNVIAYYSGWLQKPGAYNSSINDDDKNGFMTVIHNMDRSKGLDLMLHTQGGDTAATESIVDYLRRMFGTDIRVIVPQMAMSAGTMIACASKEIIMGKQSSLGPIDPQFNGIPAHGVIEEFERAVKEIQINPQTIPIWQVVIGKYHPTFIGECEKAIVWSSDMVREWLNTGMFSGDPNASTKADLVVKELNNHEDTKTHARHIPIDECRRIGLMIISLEEYMKGSEIDFQDIVLSVHHSFMHTFAMSTAIKIVENHLDIAFIQHIQVQQPVNFVQQHNAPQQLSKREE